MLRITLGLATTGDIKTTTVCDLIKLMYANNKTFFYISATESCYVHSARIKMAKEALENGSDYLLFVDHDMTFLPGSLEKMIGLDKPVVGVKYNRRGAIPPEPLVYFRDSMKQLTPMDPLYDEPFMCHGVGTGFLLVKTEVFKVIEKPWFFHGTNENVDVGDDLWFCTQVSKAGIEIWCDPTIKVGHIGDYVY